MIKINLTKEEREILLIELLNRKQRLVKSVERHEQLQQKKIEEIKETEELVNKLVR